MSQEITPETHEENKDLDGPAAVALKDASECTHLVGNPVFSPMFHTVDHVDMISCRNHIQKYFLKSWKE